MSNVSNFDFWLRPGGAIEDGYWFEGYSDRGQACLRAQEVPRGALLEEHAVSANLLSQEYPEALVEAALHARLTFAGNEKWPAPSLKNLKSCEERS